MQVERVNERKSIKYALENTKFKSDKTKFHQLRVTKQLKSTQKVTFDDIMRIKSTYLLEAKLISKYL